MAKSKPTKAKAAKAKETVEKLPFGVDEAAKALDTNPTYLRQKLRDAGIKKAGKSYGWPSSKAMHADLKKLDKAA
jgi:hypothetical protein